MPKKNISSVFLVQYYHCGFILHCDLPYFTLTCARSGKFVIFEGKFPGNFPEGIRWVISKKSPSCLGNFKERG